jgi:hypothetical protein
MGNMARDRKFLRKRDEVYVDFPDRANVMDWQVENISCGGLRVTGTLADGPGSTLRCIVSFPAAGVDIEAMVRVVWSREGSPPELGLVFADLEPGERLRLAHALYHRRRLKDAA